MVRFLTAGESHGQALVVIVDGVPSGLALDAESLTADLRRRQGGYGRGRRMAIESDRAEILSGVRQGETTGAPIALQIRNKDWANWQRTMHVGRELADDVAGIDRPVVSRPRPGHADLAGAIKYGHEDIRNVLERASARETAARVAAGAVARALIGRFGIEVASHVVRIGSIGLDNWLTVSFDQVRAISPEAPLHTADASLEPPMMAEIDRARLAGDTLGGAFEVIAANVPVGLGSYVQWDRKLDGRLAQALMSIPAIKAVGFGLGPAVSSLPGSRVHDEILPDIHQTRSGAPPLSRPTNNAGGLEGGVTNGEDLRVVAHMKPISTLMKPLRSVDLSTMTEAPATVERSDVCAVPAAAVVGEAMVCLVLADALTDKFGGDSVAEMAHNIAAVQERLRMRFAKPVAP